MLLQNMKLPSSPWNKVTTKLKDLNTKRLHYVKVPLNHIVIDFDIKDVEGKNLLKEIWKLLVNGLQHMQNIVKVNAGIHLHYIYEGDPTRLSNIYSEGIEVKVFNGDAALRRKLSKCNNIPINTINSGLPLKGEKMINFDVVKSEKGITRSYKKKSSKRISSRNKTKY